MSLTTPARSEILARVRTDYRVETGVDPLRRSKEYGLVRAVAGQSAGLYGLARFYFKQLFPDTAEDSFLWRWVGIFLGADGQKPAVAWAGGLNFTGSNATTIPSGTILARRDGAQYQTTQTVTLYGTPTAAATATATALEPGTASDLDVGAQLTLGTAIPGVAAAVTVSSVTQTGVDTESVTAGRTRLLQRLASPPRGGSKGDYIFWALKLPAATRAWEYPRQFGPNSVGVSFVRDGDGLGAEILPDASERAEMLAHLRSLVPVTVDVYVNELVAQPVDITIADLIPDTPDVRRAIEASLEDRFSRDVVPGGSIALSRIDEAISAAEGEFSHTLVQPSASPTTSHNGFLVLGNVTFGDEA